MMPASPPLPLKFRRADFLRYGFKAGMSDGAFPSITMSSRHAVYFRPLCLVLPCLVPRSESRDAARWSTSVRAVCPLCPRGPRSGSGYSVPVHPHLFGPIRPTHRHNPISPLSGLYRLPSLCVGISSTPRQPTSGSVLSLAILCRHVVLWDPGKFLGCLAPSSFTDDAGLRPKRRVSALPISHTPILMGGFISGLSYGSLSLQPVDLLAPLVGADRASTQPTGTFTSGLSTVWSPAPPPDITTETTGQFSLAGLSPLERQLASLQPLIEPDRRSYRIRLSKKTHASGVD
jgi:hypothetical protein